MSKPKKKFHYNVCQQCKKEKPRAPRSWLGEKCFKENRLKTFSRANAKRSKPGYKPEPRLVYKGKPSPWAKEHPSAAKKLAKKQKPYTIARQVLLGEPPRPSRTAAAA